MPRREEHPNQSRETLIQSNKTKFDLEILRIVTVLKNLRGEDQVTKVRNLLTSQTLPNIIAVLRFALEQKRPKQKKKYLTLINTHLEAEKVVFISHFESLDQSNFEQFTAVESAILQHLEVSFFRNLRNELQSNYKYIFTLVNQLSSIPQRQHKNLLAQIPIVLVEKNSPAAKELADLQTFLNERSITNRYRILLNSSELMSKKYGGTSLGDLCQQLQTELPSINPATMGRIMPGVAEYLIGLYTQHSAKSLWREIGNLFLANSPDTEQISALQHPLIVLIHLFNQWLVAAAFVPDHTPNGENSTLVYNLIEAAYDKGRGEHSLLGVLASLLISIANGGVKTQALVLTQQIDNYQFSQAQLLLTTNPILHVLANSDQHRINLELGLTQLDDDTFKKLGEQGLIENFLYRLKRHPSDTELLDFCAKFLVNQLDTILQKDNRDVITQQITEYLGADFFEKLRSNQTTIQSDYESLKTSTRGEISILPADGSYNIINFPQENFWAGMGINTITIHNASDDYGIYVRLSSHLLLRAVMKKDTLEIEPLDIFSQLDPRLQLFFKLAIISTFRDFVTLNYRLAAGKVFQDRPLPTPLGNTNPGFKPQYIPRVRYADSDSISQFFNEQSGKLDNYTPRLVPTHRRYLAQAKKYEGVIRHYNQTSDQRVRQSLEKEINTLRKSMNQISKEKLEGVPEGLKLETVLDPILKQQITIQTWVRGHVSPSNDNSSSLIAALFQPNTEITSSALAVAESVLKNLALFTS